MTNIKHKFQINTFQIKIIALITMTLDHFSKYQTFTVNRTFNDVLGIIGRIAAPIFLFMVVEGLRHTHSKPRYIFRLYIAGVVISITNRIVEKISGTPVLFDNTLPMLFYTALFAFCIEYIVNNRSKIKPVSIASCGLIAPFLFYILNVILQENGFSKIWNIVSIFFPSPLSVSYSTSSSIKDNETSSSLPESRNEDNLSDVSSSQSDSATLICIKDNETNFSPNESKYENNSSSTSDKNISNTTSESNNSQTEPPNSTSSESNGANYMPSGNSVSDPGTVEIIDELLDLKRDGQARGEIEPGMKIDYRKATLTKGSNVTFNIDCKQKLTIIKITLTDQKTGKCFGGSTTGKGVISFDIDADGEYVVTIENCYDKATYFTMEYRISYKANTI